MTPRGRGEAPPERLQKQFESRSPDGDGRSDATAPRVTQRRSSQGVERLTAGSEPADSHHIQQLAAQVTTLTAALQRLIDKWKSEARLCARNCVTQRGDGQMANSGYCMAFAECVEELSAVLRAASEGA